MPALDYEPPRRPTDPRADLEREEKRIEKKLLEKNLFSFVWAAWHLIDPASMRDGWHLRLLCRELEKVTRGETKNLLLNFPPRHSKSKITSVLWPVWEWISKPEQQHFCVSYDMALAHDFARMARDLIRSEWFQSRWGHRFKLAADQDAKGYYTNDKLGARISLTPKAGQTGKGGTCFIIDDPHNTRTIESDAERGGTLYWWGNVVKSRKNNPDAAFVVVMQRQHEQDLTGHILETEGDEWRHICLPARAELPAADYDPRTVEGQALWEEMYPIEALDLLQKSMDPYAVAGQYQQRPVSRQGGMIDVSWFKIVERMPAGVSKVRAWDLAATEGGGDETWGGIVAEDDEGDIYLDGVVFGQWGPAEVEEVICQVAMADTQAIPVVLPQDPGQAGKSQAFHLVSRVLRGFDVRFRRPTGPKTTRAAGWIAQARIGKVHLIRAPWNGPFLAQCRMFPRGKRDDGIDMMSDGFNELIERGGGGVGRGLNKEDYQRFGGSTPEKGSDPLEHYLRKEDREGPKGKVGFTRRRT